MKTAHQNAEIQVSCGDMTSLVFTAQCWHRMKAAELGLPYQRASSLLFGVLDVSEGGRSGFKTSFLPFHGPSSWLFIQNYKIQSESHSPATDLLSSSAGQKLALSSYISAHICWNVFRIFRDTRCPEKLKGNGTYFQYHLPFSCNEKQEEILEARQMCHISCWQQFL